MWKWFLVFLVVLFVPIPFWWNIRLIDVIQNFFVKGLHFTKMVPLNLDTCQNNLFAFDDVMKDLGLPYWLSEGTALGCIRDSALIPWDDDVDTGMECQHRHRFVTEALPRLRASGFTLTFVTNKETFFGLFRNGEKLDVDFACPGTKCQACRTSHAKCLTCDEMILHLDMKSMEFLGRTFLVPGEGYLDYLYGPMWRVPEKKKDLMI